jgi:hypothetical protein
MDGLTILKCMLKKYSGRAWTALCGSGQVQVDMKMGPIRHSEMSVKKKTFLLGLLDP